MPLDILATGYPSVDHILLVNRAPQPGETGIILDARGLEKATLGGCPCNIAVACARLGLRAGVIIVLGDDPEGRRYRDALAAEGVDTRGVQLVPGGCSPHCFLFVDPSGRHQTFYYPGISDRGDIALTLDDSLARGTRWGVITVGNATHNRAVADWFARLGVPILWSLKGDPHAYPLSLVERLANLSQLVVMNEDEAHALQTMLDLYTLDALFERGIRAIVLTMGAQGSRVIQTDRTVDIPPVPPRELVDPTGAGDAFTAGLLFGLCHDLSLELGARIGAVVASFVLEAWGCQTNLPTRAQMYKRYQATFGESLSLN
ncbi:MAG TPA: hypothetical protein EYP49_15760 [Anaerolineae bacterium]|nr:hypothetical protein [Anaerolineae bacterium]